MPQESLDVIYQSLVGQFIHALIWPDDRAAELCAIWRAELDGIAA